MTERRGIVWPLVIALGAVAIPSIASAAAADPAHVAARINQLLAKEIPIAKAAEARPPVDDETFLRRISLDVVGAPPAPNDVATFVATQGVPGDKDKRRQLVDRLLADPRYGENWAHYWRDVILYRRSDERSLVVAKPLVDYLTTKLNAGARWDQLAREFITATGDAVNHGSTAIIVAQFADPDNTAAEVSRIFLGIQIQCAQCHNHPTDHWKREEFHELAAFFPRIGIRPIPGMKGQANISVVSLNRPSPRRAPGVMTPTDVEHYMPDLQNPLAKGTRIQPVFFATGQQLSFGATDEERRGRLATWMTSPSQPWFSKAIVNRMWSELVGRGFYEPVDEMGPDHAAEAPETLDYLATAFTESGYDLKWLIRVIAATDAYQRQSRSRIAGPELTPADNSIQRLRADQLFNSLRSALEVNDVQPREGQGKRGLLNGPRGQVVRTFGYDPSVPRDEVAGSISQALWLMNSPIVNSEIRARRGGSSLSRLLAETKDNKVVATKLYLRCLGRNPKSSELATCLEHVDQTRDRTDAFEDILWALVNSTEFLQRH